MRQVETLRDRERTCGRLIEALGRVLARDGFERCGVNAVAREAKVDKVLIYRYFDGMPGLLRAYGQSGDFWPSIEEIFGEDECVLRLPPGARFEAIVAGLLKSLRQRPETLAIMAWELVQRNPLTETLAQVREEWGLALAKRAVADLDMHGEFAEDGVVLANLVIAGVQYLLLRSRGVDEFGGLALHSDEAWLRIQRAVRLLGRGLQLSISSGEQ